MGTTTFYLRHNDIGKKLGNMKKEELETMDKLSPYKEDSRAFGWRVPFELHNGNVNVLVWWTGRLMKLSDAPKELNRKYYNRYTGKTVREYEWTLLKRSILKDIEYLDRKFKNEIRKNKKPNAKQ